MARPIAQDFLHNMRFHVTVLNVGGGTNDNNFLKGPDGAAEAGFVTCGAPSLSTDATEYREGGYIYARKFPGFPSVGNVSMSRGLALKDSSFLKWMLQTVSGPAEYRCDLLVQHFHRKGLFDGGPSAELINLSGKTPGRKYYFVESFPTSHKTAGDFDAGSADVSIMDLEVAMEYFAIEEEDGKMNPAYSP